MDFTHQKLHEVVINNNRRIIISYSATRAKRAKSLSDKSITRVERLITKGTAVRKHSYLDFSVKETLKAGKMIDSTRKCIWSPRCERWEGS